jgi:hypothetical protein
MKYKIFSVALLLFMNCAFAQSEQRIQEITSNATVLLGEAAAAAKKGDAYTACTKTKEGVNLWYQIDPRAIPSSSMQDFFFADINVRNMVKIWMDVCGKY